MDREELQALQTPLKERYREEPEAALITLCAEGLLDGANIACSVATGRALEDLVAEPKATFAAVMPVSRRERLSPGRADLGIGQRRRPRLGEQPLDLDGRGAANPQLHGLAL